MSRYLVFILFAIIFFAFPYTRVHAGDVKVDTLLGNKRIELHVMPPEPFFTKDQVSSGSATEGMLIMGGAAPVAVDAKTRPTHHLVVHVFDVKTTKAVTNARIKMSFQHLDKNGVQSGTPIEVPIVVMQAIGKGEQSTHYGNNVVLPDGPLAISLVVNGKKLKLKVNVLYENNPRMNDMYMH
jgi:hypothetical protein